MSLIKKAFLLYLPVFFLPFVVDSAPHPRTISLSPPITEEIYLLGLEDHLIANTIFCSRPEQAKKKEKVGSVLNVNIERIIELKPDVVFTSPLMDKKIIEKMGKLGIKVYLFPHPKNFYGVCERFLRLSEILGKKEFALEILRRSERKHEELKLYASSYHSKKPKVFVQIGANPLFTATKDSILHSFLEDAGAVNIAKDAKTGLFSKEEVIASNPDYILIVTMGIEGEKEKERWMKIKALEAVKNRNLYLIDSQRFCSPTPLTYLQGLEELIKIFYGKEKR